MYYTPREARKFEIYFKSLTHWSCQLLKAYLTVSRSKNRNIVVGGALSASIALSKSPSPLITLGIQTHKQASSSSHGLTWLRQIIHRIVVFAQHLITVSSCHLHYISLLCCSGVIKIANGFANKTSKYKSLSRPPLSPFATTCKKSLLL